MKRPLLACGLACCFAVIFCFYLPAVAAWCLLGVLLLGAGALLLCGRGRVLLRQTAAILLVAAVLAGYALFTLYRAEQTVAALQDREGEVQATVTAVSHTGDAAVYTVKVTGCSLQNAPVRFRIRLYSSDRTMAKAGDTVRAIVQFSALQEESRSNYYPEGIYLNGSVVQGSSSVMEESGPSLFALPERIRSHVRETLYAALDYESASLLCGIALGDTDSFAEETESALSRSGVSHLVAVSGLHLSVVCSGLLALLTHLGLSVRKRSVVTLAVVLLMVAVAGFTPSICRAAIMYTILLAAQMLFFKSDALNSLGAASMLLLLLNPLAAVSLSFQLSFASTLGILLFAPGMYGRLTRFLPRMPLLRRAASYFAYGLCASISAMLCTLPVQILGFGSVSLIAPVSNLFVVFPASAALICTLISALLTALPFLSFLGFPFLFFAGVLAKYILSVTRLLAGLPLSSVSFYEPFSKLCLAAFLLLLTAVLVIGRGRRRVLRLGALLCAVLLLGSALIVDVCYAGEVSLAVMDIDQGICTVLLSGQSSAVLGCGEGGDTAARRYLEKRGIQTADLLLLPENSDTYAASAVELVKTVGCRQLLAGTEGKYGRALSALRSPAALSPEGVKIRIGRVQMEVISSSAGNCLAIFSGDWYILFSAPGLDLAELDPAYASPDMIVCGTHLPQGIDSAHPPVIVLSGNDSDGYLAAQKAGYPLYLTGGEGNLVFTFETDGGLRIRREG